ncbi:MAG: hypothetical protein Q9214_004103 [Letrouitia sp. 1 TL-2023]
MTIVIRSVWSFSFFLFSAFGLNGRTYAQTSFQGPAHTSAAPAATRASSEVIEINGTTQTFRPIFTVPAEAALAAPVLPNIKDPEARDAQTVCPGYNASNVIRTAHGLVATLTLAGPACNVYGTDIDVLNLTVEYQSADRLAVKIVPAFVDTSNSSQYLLPTNLVHQPTVDADADTTSLTNDLSFVWSNEPTFSFSVYRKSTGDSLLTTTGTKLVFENQFIEFASSLPDHYNLYGLGESIHGFRLGNNFTKTMYAADIGDPIDLNIYGSHPFYLDTRYYEVEDGGDLTLVTSNETNATADYVSYSHGVYNRNAHGQEILLRPNNITWRLLGGSIDLYIYAGPTQPEVTTAFQTSAIGLPAMQQYFTFGYHQCRWGYANWSQLQEVVDSHERFDIPLENIWNQYRDFDNDPIRYGYDEGANFLSNLHASGRHYIPIIDSAIYVPNPENASDAYEVFNNGNSTGSFMTNPDDSLYIGDVWPGYTVFPDWLSRGAGKWWSEEMTAWHDKVAFDGAWIDMSEVSSFCAGSCGSGNITLNPVHPPFGLPGEPGNVIYDYPEGFNLTNATEAAAAASASSSQKTAASPTSSNTDYLRTTPTPGVRNVDYPPYVINNVQGALGSKAVAPNATHEDGTEEYDVHNLFGHGILNATYYALLAAIPGKRPFIIGRSTFAGSGKWAGHWGNHNTLTARSQEAYVWASVADASRTAMRIRYSILPYMYTLFYLAHNTGSTVMRALAWEFPLDPLLANADRQFFLGPALLVTPVLAQGATSVDGVFPGAGKGEVYYDWYTYSPIQASPGQNVTIDAPLGHIPLYLRGGNVIPTQEPALTTRDSRKNPWGVIAALSLEGSASGVLYVDDGESLVQSSTLYVQVRNAHSHPLNETQSFTASNATLYASARGCYVDRNPLANVTVLGVQAGVSKVTLNGVAVESGVSYNETSQALVVTGLRDLTADGAWTQDWSLKWE